MYTDLVKMFCTIPRRPITEFDNKAISTAQKFNIKFENNNIQCYSWGSGKKILLAHGWGSRASHLSPLARVLSSSGFNVVAFDSPGHSSVERIVEKKYSNMFLFCRAISKVVQEIGPVYGVVGHSLGAAASAVTAAGYNKLKDYKINLEKLVLISSPTDVRSMINSFCRNNNLNSGEEEILAGELETDFDFYIKDYLIADALKKIEGKILIVHDCDDEEIPIADAKKLCDASSKIKSYFTSGSGHVKILMNRGMLSAVKDFLKEEQ